MTRFSAAVVTALGLVGQTPASPPAPTVDVTAFRAALARIEVTKTYTGNGTKGSPNYGTGFVIAADCETAYVLTAAHLMKPEAGEAGFDAGVMSYFYVDRATPRPAIIRRDFSRDSTPHDLVVLEISAAGLPRKDIPRFVVRSPMPRLAKGERVFALAQFRNNDAPAISTVVADKAGAPSDAVFYQPDPIGQPDKIGPGFSGGPILDGLGRLAGVHLDLVDGKILGLAIAGDTVLDLLNRANVRTSNLEGSAAVKPGRRYEVLDPKSLGGGFELADMLEFSAARQTFGPLAIPRAIDVRLDWNKIRPDQRVFADLQVAVEPTTALGRAGILNVGRNLVVQSTPAVTGMLDTSTPKEFRLEIPPDCGTQTYRVVGERLRNPPAGTGGIYGDVWAAGSMGAADLAYSLGGDSRALVPFVRADAWQPIPRSQEVAIDWSTGQFTGVTAVVTVVLHAYSKSGVPAISVRLRELTTGQVVGERDGMTNHGDRDATVEFRLTGPRGAGVGRYRLEASITDPAEHASVAGYLVLLGE